MSERALVFTHGDLTLTVPARLGREAFQPRYLTPLPGGFSSLLGLTEVRGRSVPLLNLSALTGLTFTGAAAQLPTLALLLEVNGDLLALPVQQVIGVVTLEELLGGFELLSEPFLAGPHTVRALNPAVLTAAVRTRLNFT
ncbi:hypothetical protein GCM10022631_14090 [Deinococcus rubellus]|uniref:chemotaxis protein CheW n=1 Tax=Deinococcus rubellus TaxID=1889240 RepID=UPI0031EC574D